MGQPTPPGDNVPLFEGLDADWNNVLSGFPEDKRAEYAPLIQERLKSYEPLKQYEDFHKSGVGSEHIQTALGIYSMLENNPKQVYDVIGERLGLTAKEVQEISEADDEDIQEDPRIAALQQQVNTMAQLMIGQRDQEVKAQQDKEADAALEKELAGVRKKFGDDLPEDELVMRMHYKGMTGEQAAQDYVNTRNQLMQRRPAPFVMGSNGAIPAKQIDPAKLSGEDTRSLVAQMMQQRVQNNKQ